MECCSLIDTTQGGKIICEGDGENKGRIIYQNCYSPDDTTNNGGSGGEGPDPYFRPATDTITTIMTLCRTEDPADPD